MVPRVLVNTPRPWNNAGVLTERSQAIPSKIREIVKKTRAVINPYRAAQGEGVCIEMSIGQPHLPPNPAVSVFAEKLRNQGFLTDYGYSPIEGRSQTLEAIINLYHHYYPTVSYQPDEVIATYGAMQALSHALAVLIENQAGVVAFEPYFTNYAAMVNNVNGRLHLVNTATTGFIPKAEVLRQVLSAHPCRAIIFNYPNNPSGVTLCANDLHPLVSVLRDFPNVFVILDDVYRDLSFVPHVSLLDVAPDFRDRTLVINSGAKALAGAPDMRIGMAASTKPVIAAMIQQQTLSTSGVALEVQQNLIAAVNAKLSGASHDWEVEIREIYQHSMQLFQHHLQKIGLNTVGKPAGTFYVMVDASKLLGRTIKPELKHPLSELQTLRSDHDLAEFFLCYAGVAMVPASVFGVDAKHGFLRASCTVSEENILRACQEMHEAMERYLR
jgi:aspartate/methionine/tyrosine aminotransferase